MPTEADRRAAEAFAADEWFIHVTDAHECVEAIELNTEKLAAHIAAARAAGAAEERARWSIAWGLVRDAVLNDRGQLAEMDVDADVTNAVLGILDDNEPAEGAADDR
jgi:hypothetical protein